MQLNSAFKCSVTAFVFTAGLAAVAFLCYGVLSLLFWNLVVFATVFCLLWSLKAYFDYQREDPEWEDRARILIRSEDEEDEDDSD